MEVYRQRRTGQDASWKEDEARAPQRANNIQAYVGASFEKCINNALFENLLGTLWEPIGGSLWTNVLE